MLPMNDSQPNQSEGSQKQSMHERTSVKISAAALAALAVTGAYKMLAPSDESASLRTVATEASPSPEATPPTTEQLVTAMQNREPNQRILTLDIGDGNELEVGGDIFEAPDPAGKKVNFLAKTRVSMPQYVVNGGIPYACGNITRSLDILCVAIDGTNTELSVFNPTTNTSTPLILSTQPLATREVTIASVTESGLALSADGSNIASNHGNAANTANG